MKRDGNGVVLSRREWLYVTAAWLLTCGLTLAATWRYGLGASTDGVYYLSAADNLAAGRGLIDFAGNPLSSWAPLLPAGIALLHRLTGLSVLNAALLLNLLSAAAFLWLAARLVKGSGLRSELWLPVALLALAISLSVQSLMSNVATEPLFLALVFWFLVRAREYYAQPSWRNLLWMALSAALAPLLRWVGVTLVLSGEVVLMLRHWRLWKDWLLRSLAFGALGSLPLLAWVLGRNYPLTGTLFGPRQTQFDFIDPLGNLVIFGTRISEWFLPNSLTKRVDVWVIVLIGVGLLALWNSKARWRSAGKRILKDANQVLVVFWVVYFVFMMYVVATQEHTDRFDDRYLLPLFLPLLIMLFIVLDELLLPKLKGWGRVALSVGLVLWLSYLGFLTTRFVASSMDEGVAFYNLYNIGDYQRSSMIEFIQDYDFEEGVPVYSNDAPAVYFYTGLAVRNSLDDSVNYKAQDEQVLAEADGWPPEEAAYFVWVLPNWKEHYFTPKQLGRITNLTLIWGDPDGELYWAQPKVD